MRQGRRVTGRTQRQTGFTQRQLAAFHRQAGQGDRVIGRHDDRWRHKRAIVVIAQANHPLLNEFGNTIEPGGRKTNDRVNATCHLFKQHKGVPATHLTTWRTGGRRTSGSCFSHLGRVFACRDGRLEFFNVCQLGFAGGQRFRGINVGCRVWAQQCRGQGHGAFAAHGQLTTTSLQMDCHRTRSARLQLLTGKHTITFNQHSAGTITGNRNYLANHVANDTDQTSHVHSLCCRAHSACVITRTCKSSGREAGSIARDGKKRGRFKSFGLHNPLKNPTKTAVKLPSVN